MDGVKEDMEMAILRGDYYPIAKQLFLGGVKRMSSASVNITGAVCLTEDNWIGMRMYVMAPCRETASAIIPSILDVTKRFEFEALPNTLMRHLEIALEKKGRVAPIREFWPADAAPLRR